MNIWEIFSEYVVDNYADSKKIVEVGVGKILEPSNLIEEKLESVEVLRVDIKPSSDKIIKDDIYKPTEDIYNNADLIYSIRPPEELQKAIIDLSERFGCDVIIKPLSTEEINHDLQNKLKLVNYKRLSLYVLKRA